MSSAIPDIKKFRSPTGDAGFLVERSDSVTSTNAEIRWDESEGQWTFTGGGVSANLSITSGDAEADLILQDVSSGDLITLDGSSGEARYVGNGAFTLGSRADGSTVGPDSFAIGTDVNSSGLRSTATGSNTEATNNFSTATGNQTLASGETSTALGSYTEASGSSSTAMGASTEASGLNSTAMGAATIASGKDSTAMGDATLASGIASTSMGYATRSRMYGGTVQGIWSEDYIAESNEPTDISSIAAADRVLAVGVGDNPDANSGDGGYFDGRGRADGLYVTYRDGTHIRHGLSVDAYNESLGEYETVFEVNENGDIVRGGGNLSGGGASVAGSDGEVQFNDSGSLGASPDLAFNGSSLVSSGFTVQSGGTFDMDFVADIPTTVNVQHSNSGSLILTWFVIAETPTGLLTAQNGDGRENLPAPDSSNSVEVNWEERSEAEKYYVVVEQFDLSAFQLTYRVIDEITDTTTTSLVDTGQGTLLANSGLSNIPQENETFGQVFFTTRRFSSNTETGGLLMNADVTGEVARTPLDLARYEGGGAFTFGQRQPGEAIGDGSFAAGRPGLIASGRGAIALGENASATSNSAVAMGSSTLASGIGSFAAGQGSEATDNNAFAVGAATQATEFNAVAEGNQTLSSGSAAHAEGFLTEALGTSSHSEGSNSLARGRSSHAGGDNTVAWPYASRVVGFFNEDYLGGLTENPPPAQQGIEDFNSLSERIFAVGVGGDPNATPSSRDYIDGRGRVDGLYVTVREGTHIRHGLSVDSYNDSLGDYETELRVGPEIFEGTDASQVLVRNPNTNELEYVDGSMLGGGGNANLEAGLGLSSTLNASTGVTTLDVDPIEQDTESEFILRDSSTGELVVLDEPDRSAKYEGNGAFTLGYRIGAIGESSLVVNGADGGSGNEASGRYSFVGGYQNTSTKDQSFTFGIFNTNESIRGFVHGVANDVTGSNSIAFGEGITLSGRRSFAHGSSGIGGQYVTEVTSNRSFTAGQGLKNRVAGSAVFGFFNEDYSIATENEEIGDLVSTSRIFAVGAGSDPNGVVDGSFYIDDRGLIDAFYITLRDGTHIRHGLSLDAYDETSEEYELELRIPERIQAGSDASQVLVRNPNTKELEYIDANNFSGGGSTSVVGGTGIDSSYNASTDAFTVELSDVVAKAVDFGGSVRVTSGEMEVTTPGLGQILRSPDGTRFRVKVKNDGTIVSEEL
jgi:hypothetical protein